MKEKQNFNKKANNKPAKPVKPALPLQVTLQEMMEWKKEQNNKGKNR